MRLENNAALLALYMREFDAAERALLRLAYIEQPSATHPPF